jgi:hypothetical protein
MSEEEQNYPSAKTFSLERKRLEWAEAYSMGMSARDIYMAEDGAVDLSTIKEQIEKGILESDMPLSPDVRRVRVNNIIDRAYTMINAEYSRIQKLMADSNYEGMNLRTEVIRSGGGQELSRVVSNRMKSPTRDITGLLKSLKEIATLESQVNGVSKAGEDGPRKIEVSIKGCSDDMVYIDATQAPDVKSKSWEDSE